MIALKEEGEAWAAAAAMKSHGRSRAAACLPPSALRPSWARLRLPARAHAKCSSCLPSLPPLSLRRSTLPAPRMLVTNEPSGRHRLLPLEWLRKPFLWKGYCMQQPTLGLSQSSPFPSPAVLKVGLNSHKPPMTQVTCSCHPSSRAFRTHLKQTFNQTLNVI